MEQVKFKLIGESAMLLHNNRLANPLDPYSQVIKQCSGKKKKTIEDIWELARLEWEGGFYFNEDGVVALPNRVINKCMERGATKQKNGMLWKTGCIINEDDCPVSYKGKEIKYNGSGEIPSPELDQFFTPEYYFQTMAKVGQASLLRTRPILKDWSLSFTVMYEPSVIDRSSLIQCAVDAGRLVGLCDWRIEKGGRYGRFKVDVIEEQ